MSIEPDLDALNRLAKRMTKRFKYINSGGCAVVSFLMHEKLLGIADNVRVIFFSSERDDRPSLAEVLANNQGKYDMRLLNRNGFYCDHAITLFDYKGVTYMWDTDQGAIPYSEYNRDTGRKPWGYDEKFYHVPLIVNYHVAYKGAYCWNDTFDRSQIRGMQQSIRRSKLHKEAA